MEAATERLVPHGRRAIVIIEAALHTAQPPGRKNLIVALRRIHDADAVPLLRHFAVFDASPDVRTEARWTLEQWALEKGELGAKSRAALRTVDELKGREEAG